MVLDTGSVRRLSLNADLVLDIRLGATSIGQIEDQQEAEASACRQIPRRLSCVSLRRLLDNSFAGTVEKPLKNTWHKFVFRGHEFPNAWLSFSKRVAPGVLASCGDDPYVKLAWRFLWVPCDPTSGEALIDRCPGCHNRLHWGHQSLHHCGVCNYDLRRARPTYLDPEIVEASRMFANAIGLNEARKAMRIPLPAPFQKLSVEEQIRVMSWCARLLGRLDRTSIPGNIENASAGLAMAMQWPQPLMQAVDLLVRQCQTTEEAPGKILKLFGDVGVPSIKDAVIAQANHLLNARLRREPPSGTKTLPLPRYILVD